MSGLPASTERRRHLPRPTVRLRLTLVYGALFTGCGGALLAIVYLLSRTSRFIAIRDPIYYHGQLERIAPLLSRLRTDPAQFNAVVSRLQQRGVNVQSVIDLHRLLLLSAFAFAFMVLVSVALGWLVAGRVLRPLRRITYTAQQISSSNLDQRIALDGPDDELRELGATFDELLSRLDASFIAQRQFVANASHELRTPLSRQRTLLEVALGDPDASVESLQANHERLLAAGAEQERLIEALLTLARSEQGVTHPEPLNLKLLVRDVLDARSDLAERHGVHVDASLDTAAIVGDRQLVERLVSNLIGNAIVHNEAGGDVEVRTGATIASAVGGPQAVITVINGGPVVAATEVSRLLEPFERSDETRMSKREGAGVGLSIVRAIAAAHKATLTIVARPDGGLRVDVCFPARVDATGASKATD
jgi:signal transduction histidine kinase